ncbi:putative modification methylase HindII [Capnocytophaga cynodegmi]|uniref:site-specific DNA-methyltransferase (adenine-specific) n=2 Tax=Capnocytophaga cynodegmi TaxID=28189 RepID=A0A0B7HNM0_9FLAO|nr:putative modification methylase HindII [Capnocytophaga cynodegmi]CEN40890.1 putative modification methylase HindII [Capnocytophaga cynodegmi]
MNEFFRSFARRNYKTLKSLNDLKMNIPAKQSTKNKFGQYFTPEVVANFMIDLANIPKESKILEPSCGEGVFLNLLKEKGYHNLSAFEIDKELSKDFDFVRYESFISAKIDEKFDLIIGNPPYIRWKNLEEELKQELLKNETWNKYFNSLCDYLYIFILKSIELLNEKGQLIFICPEYWMNTTHSVSLRNYMVQNGYFEEIYHFNETPIFDKATVSTVIFKYVKSCIKKEKIQVSKYHSNKKLSSEILENLKNKKKFEDVYYFDVHQFKFNERWILQPEKLKRKLELLENNCLKKNQSTLLSLFDENKQEFHTIGDFCDIGNGLVSGLDKAFQVSGCPLTKEETQATINVVKAKNINPYVANDITIYIYIEEELEESEFIKKYPNFYLHFQKYKSQLEKRYQYNRKINYWEWVFLRNFNLFKKQEERIFVPCKERISNKNYFRFALVDKDIFPTQDVTAIFRKPNINESIEYILAYLNTPIVFDWLKSNGIIKGNIVEFSEKPISSIPFKAIDWSNEKEVEIHNFISENVRNYLKKPNELLLNLINESFNNLLFVK